MSTINSIPFRSTIFYRTDGTVAPIGTVFTISTNGLLAFSDSLSLNTLTASSITGNITTLSSITASTILTTGNNIALGQSVAFPNRYLELGTDVVDSVYLDFHSKDSTLSDYSTRIQSLGGTTTGTGALNTTASTIGLMANVGIGTTSPATKLHVYQSLGSTSFYNTYGTATAMPAQLVLDASSHRLYLGSYYTGGVGENAVIQSSSYYSSTDHSGTLLLNPNGGSVGIGTTGAGSLLTIFGTATTSASDAIIILDNSRTGGVTAAGGSIGSLQFNNNGISAGSIQSVVDIGGANNNGALAFYTRTDYVTYAERMRINRSGNVGIGTANPAGRLAIYTTSADHTAAPDGNPTNHQLIITNSKSGTTNYAMAIGMDQTFGCGYINAAGNAAFQPVCLQTRGGNVGIGTTNPNTTTLLDVNGITRSIGGFGTNSGSVPGLTTTGTIVHRFRGGAALLSIIGQNNLIYLGFVQWIGNVTSPGVTAIISGGYTATIDGTPDITIKTTAGTSNASWNITYLACPGYAGPGTFTPGF